MSIPYATTTVAIAQPPNLDRDAVGYGPTDPGPTVLETAVPACLTRVRLTSPGYGTQADEWILLVDLDVVLERHYLVTDESSGLQYRVTSIVDRAVAGPAASLNHRRATLEAASV